MKPLIEADSEHVAGAFLFATELSGALGYTLDEEDALHLNNLIGLLQLKLKSMK